MCCGDIMSIPNFVNISLLLQVSMSEVLMIKGERLNFRTEGIKPNVVLGLFVL